MVRDDLATSHTEHNFDPIRLNFRREAACFLSRHLHRLDLADFDFVLSLARAVPPPINACYVIVPVHISEDSLDNYLQLLGPQLLASESTAVILVNAQASNVSSENFNQGIKRAHAVVRDSPARSRVVIQGRLFHTPVTMGRIRGLMADAVIINAYVNQVLHPIIISNDVDALAVAGRYIETFTDRFAGDSGLKLAAGVVEYGYTGSVASDVLNHTPVPELFLFNELNKAINRCASEGLINFERRVWIECANAAFSAAAYCAVGGFDFDLKCGEDDSLGKAINRLNPNAFESDWPSERTLYTPDPIMSCSLEAESWIVTDPRRVLLAIASGLPGIEAWAELPFMETTGASMKSADLAIRCANLPELITPTVLAQAAAGHCDAQVAVVSRLQQLLGRSIAYDRKAQTPEQVGRVLSALGLSAGTTASIRWGDGDLFARLCDTVRSCS